MNKNIQHIWFDMDGTLTIHTDKFNKVHDELRYKTYAEVVGREVSYSLICEYEDLYKQYGSNSAVFTSLGKSSNYWMQYFDQIDQDLYYQPVPEIFKTLENLQKRISISLFTNARLENTQKTLAVVNISFKWFKHILTGDDVMNRKPALDGFYEIIRLSSIDPSGILYVGDRVSVDVKPAKAVGMQTCLLYDSSKEADYSFESMRELLTIV
jgi:HAD superfamily hydrolase (TIGR01549 family)